MNGPDGKLGGKVAPSNWLKILSVVKHCDQVHAETEMAGEISATAAEVVDVRQSTHGGREETNGLIYGLVQSGKKYWCHGG